MKLMFKDGREMHVNPSMISVAFIGLQNTYHITMVDCYAWELDKASYERVVEWIERCVDE